MKNKITCFISYSHDNNNIQKFKKLESLVTDSSYYVNYSEKKNKSAFSDETIWKYLHDRIAGSSCTILLLTEDILSYNNAKIAYKINDFINSGWIYNEISASLRDWKDNRINGLVCVIDDNLVSKIIDFNTSYNLLTGYYHLPEILKVNSEYIVFVKFSDFINNHYQYLSNAIENRNKQIESNGNAFNIKYDLHNRRY